MFFSWYFFVHLKKLVDLFATSYLVCVLFSRREWGFHVVHTILKCKVLLCARTLGSSLFILEHFLDPFWLVTSFVEVSFNFFILQSLDPLYSLISFPTIRHWICVFYFTHIMRNAHFMGELLLYWPSKFFPPISPVDADGGEI